MLFKRKFIINYNYDAYYYLDLIFASKNNEKYKLCLLLSVERKDDKLKFLVFNILTLKRYYAEDIVSFEEYLVP